MSADYLTKVHQVGLKKYVALDNVSFSLKNGHILGLMGPNGAGKSSLLNILAMQQSRSQGRVFY